MIGLMPYTGSVEIFPTAVVANWASSAYNSSTQTFTGNINTIVGRLYVLATAGSTSSTYLNTPSGWTLGYRASNITFHYKVATSTSTSLSTTVAGTGVINSPPIIFEINNFTTAVPAVTNTSVTSAGVSLSASVTIPTKNTLVLTSLWLSAARTTSVSSSAGDPSPVFFATDTVNAGEIETYTTTKTPAGSYTFSTSWTPSADARMALYAIR